MEVCEVCGAFLIVGDAQSRIDDHLMGKQHMGYARLKNAVNEIQEQRKKYVEEREKQREEERKKRMNRTRYFYFFYCIFNLDYYLLFIFIAEVIPKI